MVAVRVEDVLALWREAERVRDALAENDPEWSMVSDEVADLAQIVERLSATADDTAAILAASGDRIALARRLIEQVGRSNRASVRSRVVADLRGAARTEIVTFPRDDLEFRAQVLHAAELADGRVDAEVMVRVREAYPDAVASRAVDLAIVDGIPRYYVYRDGRYRSHCAQPSAAGSVNDRAVESEAPRAS
jgi:hypothetical protein